MSRAASLVSFARGPARPSRARETPRFGSIDARACLLLLGGCASTAVITRAEELEQIVEAATRRGAQQCAPQELALAKVNLEFARLELSQGDRRRADHHLTLAEPNAKAALRVASDSKCKSSAAQAPLAAGADEGAP